MKNLILSLSFLFIAYTSLSQSFQEFWSVFQKNMKSKEYALKNISFPYYYSCNYFAVVDDNGKVHDGNGEITKAMFEKEGPQLFVYGNAFISQTFSKTAYPNNSKLSIGKYVDGYINEYLKNQFLSRYENLNDIYYISEKGNENDAIGYKAYFKKVDGNFKFIGFEGEEQGD